MTIVRSICGKKKKTRKKKNYDIVTWTLDKRDNMLHDPPCISKTPTGRVHIKETFEINRSQGCLLVTGDKKRGCLDYEIITVHYPVWATAHDHTLY